MTGNLTHRFCLALACVLAIRAAVAQNSTFTYQGRLNNGGVPASGIYDLRFTIHDALSGGALVAAPLTNAAVSVSNGLFTAQLDFGAGVFTGADRWLEISVRTNSSGAFTALAPRQFVTPTPSSIFAARAATANLVNAADVAGTLSLSQLPQVLVTNGASNVSFSGAFFGNGTGLSNVNAGQLSGLAATNFWQLGGNNVSTGQVLGSINNQPLEFTVNGQRAFRLEPASNSAPNVIGGASGNSVATGGYGATIAGGYNNEIQPLAHNSTISGGSNNRAETNASGSTIGGGTFHIIQPFASGATIGGGSDNRVGTNAILSTIGGGLFNATFGAYATVPGGSFNSAGASSFAAGSHAKATNSGSFVWADSTGGDFTTTGSNQFLIRASGGVGINTNTLSGAALNVAGTVLATTLQAANFVGSGANVSNVNAAQLNGLAATNFWQLGGNTVSAGQVLGSTNYQAVEITVNGRRALRLEPPSAPSLLLPNIIAGGPNNIVGPGVEGVAILGGNQNIIQSNSSLSVIAGGNANTIRGSSSFTSIGGGFGNSISNASATTIAGGNANSVQDSAHFSVVGGGNANVIGANARLSTAVGGEANAIQPNSEYSSIGGGQMNTNAGSYATVPGGDQNSASANAFAAGHRAKANHRGAFVWADSTDADFSSTGSNQFLIRASGGVGINTNSLSGAALNVAGTVIATTLQTLNFVGSGANISNVNAAQLTGLAASNFWQLGGNNVSTGQVLGSTNNQPLELAVNGVRAFRLEQFMGTPNVVGGAAVNYAAPDIGGVTISGGGASLYNGVPQSNSVASFFGAIGGGYGNSIGTYAENATIAGGENNVIQLAAGKATIGGGSFNSIQGGGNGAVIAGGAQNSIWANSPQTTIGGGYSNVIQNAAAKATLAGGSRNTIETGASGAVLSGGISNNIHNYAASSVLGGGEQNDVTSFASFSTLSGGYQNTNIGSYATVPGGDQNSASTNAFAAGHRAKANHRGAFVWADSTDADFSSTATNQFLIRAAGGVGINTNSVSGAALNVAGSIRASGSFVGSGDGLTSLAASNITGVLGTAQVPGLDASKITTGTLADTRLSSNIALLNGNQTFTGANVISNSAGQPDLLFRGNSVLRLLAFDNGNYIQSGSAYSPGSTNDLYFTGLSGTPVQMVVKAGGNVGIGTNSPAAKLDVAGSGWFREDAGGLPATAGSGVRIFNQTSGGGGQIFAYNYQSGASPNLILQAPGGNVGIGITNPANRLHVAGGITCTALTQTSDRNAKENFESISTAEVLDKVAALPISTWNFKEAKGERHLGPMAQDFYTAFGLGRGETTITSVDADGVALAAIQGLNQKLDAQIKENAALRKELEQIKQLLMQRKGD